MNELKVILFLTLTVISRATSKDVLGCGGFIKSHVPIDFSKVEVKLLTKQGILKDRINCAPTNGYYFVPLYDKGEYILELEPPPGWSFTPNKVDLVVDGVSDLCSQGKDIDFIFKGFGITGKVESLGSRRGPEGVEIELKSANEVRKTITSDGGDFFFTPVYPGTYSVRISNSKWKVNKESVNVVVTEGNTELPRLSLLIQGYDVTGSVKNEGEPIKDTTVLLFSATGGDIPGVDGCNRQGLPTLKNKPICSVKSNDNGEFTFPVVPTGRYFLMPYYDSQNIYYQPNSIGFTVERSSVKLQEHFEIIGFSITGRVLKSPTGAPIANAKIFSNGKHVTKTNAQGVYKLEKLKAGTLNLKAEFEGVIFNEVALKINPNSKDLPDLVPSSFKVCGNVVSKKSETVTFSKIGSTTIYTTQSDSRNGQFCEFLSPGKYDVQVVVNTIEAQKGLQFFPKVIQIEVGSDQKSKIVFSQLKATVKGRLDCFDVKDCEGLELILKLNGDNSERSKISISVIDFEYKIADIHPGIYTASLSNNNLCWKENSQIINVNSVEIQIPDFVQMGYSVVFVSSHDTQVSYKLPNQPGTKIVDVTKGRMSHCLEKPGDYDFQLSSCHSYESNSIHYSTNSPRNEIFLNALKHTTTFLIASDSMIGDVTASITLEGVKTESGPLQFAGNGYEVKLLLSPAESAVVTPHSELLYFEPSTLVIGGSVDCEHLGAKFVAVRGLVFSGKVSPPLGGVVITVESNDFETLMAETDQSGSYKFPPLNKDKNYKLSAKKESYVLVGPNDKGDFVAHKLAEIVIEVIDDTSKEPLQDALLSLSGGESYRSNLQTNAEGKIAFHSLSPGEYFLRPMMKEYSFDPPSKIIAVKEGQTVNVKLTGKRVAYSAYGTVTSLNGDPEENINVVAQGTGNCSHFSEESISEGSGRFRIRGLQPYCSYEIKVKTLNNIERSAPKLLQVDKVTSDISGLKIVIFRPTSNLDLLVKVTARNPEHYKGLTVKVSRESAPAGVVYVGRIDSPSASNQGVLVQVPPIPIDGKTYTVQLESSHNNKFDPEPETFVANSSFKFVDLSFNVKASSSEQDIKQTSVLTLVFIFAVMVAVYNIDKISVCFRDTVGVYVFDVIGAAGKKVANGGSEYAVAEDDIDKIVASINSIKKKPKPKKIFTR